MMIFDVLDIINDMNNVDQLEQIFSRVHFNTSVITPEIKADILDSAKEVLKMGETKVYKYIKDAYSIK